MSEQRWSGDPQAREAFQAGFDWANHWGHCHNAYDVATKRRHYEGVDVAAFVSGALAWKPSLRRVRA